MTLEHIDNFLSKNVNSLYENKVNQALVINLSERSFYRYVIPEMYLENYKGGVALGLRLYEDFLTKSTEDFREPIIITFSELLNQNIPFTDQCVFTFKSLLTGMVMHNFLSGDIGRKLLKINVCALVIIGRCTDYVDLVINEKAVVFNLSNISADFTVTEIIKKHGKSVLIPGSKKLISSCFYKYNLSGSGDLGYLINSRNVKLIKFDILIRTDLAESTITKDLIKELSKSDDYKDYVNATSSVFIKDAINRGWAPIHNYSYRYDPRLMYLLPDEIKNEVKRKRNYIRSNIPDFSALLMLGPNMDSFDLKVITDRFDFCLQRVIDPASLFLSIDNLDDTYGEGSSLVDIIGIKVNSNSKTSTNNTYIYGPFDYRGAPEQGVLSAFGFYIPLYRSLITNNKFDTSKLINTLNEYAFEMGLQSLGFDSKINAFIKSKNSLIKCISRIIMKDSKGLKPSDKTLFSDVNKIEKIVRIITNLGMRYIFLFYKTQIIDNKKKPSVPDYFSLVSKSNYKIDSVFKSNILIPEFSVLLNSVWRTYGN